MRNMTLIVTPRSVKKLFSFCTRIVARARRMASRNCIGRGRARVGISRPYAPPVRGVPSGRQLDGWRASLAPNFRVRVPGPESRVPIPHSLRFMTAELDQSPERHRWALEGHRVTQLCVDATSARLHSWSLQASL